MNSLDALQLQLRLEGFEVFHEDRLRQVDVVPGEEMPLLILAQLADGRVTVYFDESLSHALYLEMLEQVQQVHFPSIDPFLKMIAAQNIQVDIGHYKTYLFPASFLEFTSADVKCRSKNDSQVEKFGFGGFAGRVYGIERDGKLVSACASTREDQRCGEAWVYTDPQYRHHGLAAQVVSAWAKDLLFAGKVPFYSHTIRNIASAGLAEYLGLPPVYEEVVISYAETSSP